MTRVSYGHSRFALSALLLLFAINLFSCSDNSSDPVSPGDTDADWKTGKSVSYDLSTGQADISDIVPGASLKTSGGPGGSVGIAPVESGPALSFASTQIEVAWDSGHPLDITIAGETGGEVLLFAYGALEKASTDGRTGVDDWWSVPVTDAVDGAFTFSLPVGQPGVGKTAADVPKRQFAIAKLAPGSSEKAKLAAGAGVCQFLA